MAKDPAVLLYTSDFLSGTYTMTDEQVGKYIRLLCLQHQQGKLSKQDMLTICKAYDEKIWSKFDEVDGFYINKRMYEEAEKRSKYTESRRNNAKKQAYAEHMPKHMVYHMENENENINENINRSKFKKPELHEVSEYFMQLEIPSEAESYFNYYTANGWKVGKNPMKDWKAAARNWIKNAKTYKNGNDKKSSFEHYQQYHAESDAFFAEYDRQFRPHVLGSEEKPKNEGS